MSIKSKTSNKEETDPTFTQECKEQQQVNNLPLPPSTISLSVKKKELITARLLNENLYMKNDGSQQPQRKELNDTKLTNDDKTNYASDHVPNDTTLTVNTTCSSSSLDNSLTLDNWDAEQSEEEVEEKIVSEPLPSLSSSIIEPESSTLLDNYVPLVPTLLGNISSSNDLVISEISDTIGRLKEWKGKRLYSNEIDKIMKEQEEKEKIVDSDCSVDWEEEEEEGEEEEEIVNDIIANEEEIWKLKTVVQAHNDDVLPELSLLDDHNKIESKLEKFRMEMKINEWERDFKSKNKVDGNNTNPKSEEKVGDVIDSNNFSNAKILAELQSELDLLDCDVEIYKS